MLDKKGPEGPFIFRQYEIYYSTTVSAGVEVSITSTAVVSLTTVSSLVVSPSELESQETKPIVTKLIAIKYINFFIFIFFWVINNFLFMV